MSLYRTFAVVYKLEFTITTRLSQKTSMYMLSAHEKINVLKKKKKLRSHESGRLGQNRWSCIDDKEFQTLITCLQLIIIRYTIYIPKHLPSPLPLPPQIPVDSHYKVTAGSLWGLCRDNHLQTITEV